MADGLPELTTDVEVLPTAPEVSDYIYTKNSPLDNGQNPLVEHTLTLRNNPAKTAYYKINLDIRVMQYKNGEFQREKIINRYRLASANTVLKGLAQKKVTKRYSLLPWVFYTDK